MYVILCDRVKVKEFFVIVIRVIVFFLDSFVFMNIEVVLV